MAQFTDHRIVETSPGDGFWRHIQRYSPQTVGYIADPGDQADYRCFVAVAADGEFLGLSVVAVAPLGFGPLADRTVACLENILVAEGQRKRGIGSELLRAVLAASWQAGAEHIWWTVEYENVPAIRFYHANGATFFPEEDSASPVPEPYYLAVIQNPSRMAGPEQQR